MNQSGKRLTFALLGVASLFYVNAPSLAEDQIAPQIKVVPLDAGDQPYLLLLKGQPETKSFRSGLVPAVADLSQKQVHQTGVITAWLKKNSTPCHIQQIQLVMSPETLERRSRWHPG